MTGGRGVLSTNARSGGAKAERPSVRYRTQGFLTVHRSSTRVQLFERRGLTGVARRSATSIFISVASINSRWNDLTVKTWSFLTLSSPIVCVSCSCVPNVETLSKDAFKSAQQ